MKRWSDNPIITRRDIPAVTGRLADPSAVFNPGAIKLNDLYYLMLRVQTRGRETFLIPATSTDGQAIEVLPEVITIAGMDRVREQIYHVYDPRLTRIGEDIFAVMAVDTAAGCRLATAGMTSLSRFELISFDQEGDRRNGVLFPQKFGDRYLRLQRPNVTGSGMKPGSGTQIMLAESGDLSNWHELGPVMGGRARYWDELVGSGPPPIKTRAGWLHIYHGIATHFASSNIYQAGAVLLDLADPQQVIARSTNNILEPREPYELIGQVPNVVFPSGMIVEDYDDEGFALPDSVVRVYYGAADTVTALALTTVRELLDSCEEPK